MIWYAQKLDGWSGEYSLDRNHMHTALSNRDLYSGNRIGVYDKALPVKVVQE